jgi:hypothetical protein
MHDRDTVSLARHHTASRLPLEDDDGRNWQHATSRS